MRRLADKGILLACGLTLLFYRPQVGAIDVAALLTAVTLCALGSYCGERFRLAAGILYPALCCLNGAFLPFLPALTYDGFSGRRRLLYGLWLAPVLLRLGTVPPALTVSVLVFTGAALLLGLRTQRLLRYRSQYQEAQDGARELSLHLERQNRELLDKQDYEVRLATLNERNRIAREIHDNVGHLLSRSLLQVGALQVVNRDETVRQGLDTVRDTLSGAMDSIRRSVHDLHDESVDLHMQLEAMLRDFTFCPVKLDYDSGEMDRGLKLAFLAIVREALSNVMRHSDATMASVTVREHPALYQLIIRDNGTRRPESDGRGIGLSNMAERVEAYRGTFRIDRDAGFKLFISIPKEGVRP